MNDFVKVPTKKDWVLELMRGMIGTFGSRHLLFYFDTRMRFVELDEEGERTYCDLNSIPCDRTFYIVDQKGLELHVGDFSSFRFCSECEEGVSDD